METKKLTINGLLGSDGFIPFGKDKVEEKETKENIYEMLHKENPIKKLKEFSLFSDKDKIKYHKLEYLNKYTFDKKNNVALYLLSRTFIIPKNIKNNMVALHHKEIDFKLPLYYLSITDIQGIELDNTKYTVRLVLKHVDPKQQNLLMPLIFQRKYIKNNLDSYCDKWNKIAGKYVHPYFTDIVKNKQYIIPSHAEKLEIIFDKTIDIKKVNIECKVYDLFAYGGFFNCGWCFS